MKPICQNCQYYREPGSGDEIIPGTGKWCSNSQSKWFLMRVGVEHGCDGFQARGKKAPLGLRLKSKGLGLVNRIMRKK